VRLATRLKRIAPKISEEDSINCNDVNKPKTIRKMLTELNDEFMILSDLIITTGYTGVQDNYKIRQKLNAIIYDVRKAQDLMIKIRSSTKNKNQEENEKKDKKDKDS
jgi:NADH:ubiquinone oxidoreductase subunit C